MAIVAFRSTRYHDYPYCAGAFTLLLYSIPPILFTLLPRPTQDIPLTRCSHACVISANFEIILCITLHSAWEVFGVARISYEGIDRFANGTANYEMSGVRGASDSEGRGE